MARAFGREGWGVNHKRVERIWRQEGLKVPQRQPKRGRLWLNDGSCIRLRPLYRGHVWSYDFVASRTHDGRALKLLTVLDEHTRECLAIVVARKIRSHDVLEVLADLFVRHGPPEYLRSDNGPEFTAKLVRPCTATLDTPAIGSDGARIDFGTVVTDPENDSFTVAWTASAGSLSTSSGLNTTLERLDPHGWSIGHGDGHRHRQRRRGIHRHRHRTRAGLRLGRRYRPDDTGATSASPGRWRLRSSRSDQDEFLPRRALLRAAARPDRGVDALRPGTKVDWRYSRGWNPGVHFVQPDLRLHRLVPRN